MLNKIKLSLRISDSDLDTDIQQNIDSCICDMYRVGVIIPENPENDPLIVKAVDLYIKQQYDYMGKGEEYGKNYSKLRDALSLYEKYRGE